MKIRFLSCILILCFISVMKCTQTCPSVDWPSYSDSIMDYISRRNAKYHRTRRLSDLPKYDFIVAGGGSAGCTLVYKLLKRNPNLKILLCEKGLSGDNDENIRNFQYLGRLANYQYPDYTVPQTNLDYRNLSIGTGKVLGGCSSHNHAYWIRCHRNDYNEWAKLVQDRRWSYKHMRKIFKSLETFPRGSAERGKHGPVYVTEDFTNTDLNQEIKDEIINSNPSFYKNNPDYNSGWNTGVYIAQLNVKKASDGVGVRQDSFRTQVKKQLCNSNLNVLIETTVDRVALDRNNRVKYVVIQRGGKSYKVRATYETILSAGALRTPLILMRSGIGDRSHLKKLNIKCRKHLPGVGQNLQDHGAVFQLFDFDSAVINKLVSVSGIFKDIKTVIKGKYHPNHQFFASIYKEDPNLFFGKFAMVALLLHPKSRGSVTMNSRDPHANPIVDPKYLHHSSDKQEFLDLFKTTIKIGDLLINKGYLTSRFSPSTSLNTDSEIFEALKNSFGTAWHFAGTCKMSRKGDKYGVVDSKLRVFGIKGLRVADTSIMPTLTSGNTNQPAMAIGAKCAKIIIKIYRL